MRRPVAGEQLVKMYQCDNCVRLWDFDELNNIQRYFERVDEDGPDPDGECPSCGCLAYEILVPAAVAIGRRLTVESSRRCPV